MPLTVPAVVVMVEEMAVCVFSRGCPCSAIYDGDSSKHQRICSCGTSTWLFIQLNMNIRLLFAALDIFELKLNMFIRYY
jgi:hypothetical protein